MNWNKIFGAVLLVIGFGALFSITATAHGVVESIKIWGVSAGLAAIIISGIALCMPIPKDKPKR